MGIDLIAPCLAIPRGREPDWVAAARWIAELQPAVLFGAGELFPLDAWLEEGRYADEEALSDEHAIVLGARESLMLAAAKVRAAIESPAAARLVVMDLPNHCVYATCSLDSLVEDLDLNHSFLLVGESGVAKAAGFDHWTQFAATPLDERTSSRTAREESAVPTSEVVPIVAGEPEPASLGPDSIAWVAVDEPRWQDGEDYVKCNGLPDSLNEGLELIRGYFLDGYARMVSPDSVGDVELLIIADRDAFGERAAECLEALGEECALDAIGAVGWCARGARPRCRGATSTP